MVTKNINIILNVIIILLIIVILFIKKKEFFADDDQYSTLANNDKQNLSKIIKMTTNDNTHVQPPTLNLEQLNSNYVTLKPDLSSYIDYSDNYIGINSDNIVSSQNKNITLLKISEFLLDTQKEFTPNQNTKYLEIMFCGKGAKGGEYNKPNETNGYGGGSGGYVHFRVDLLKGNWENILMGFPENNQFSWIKFTESKEYELLAMIGNGMGISGGVKHDDKSLGNNMLVDRFKVHTINTMEIKTTVLLSLKGDDGESGTKLNKSNFSSCGGSSFLGRGGSIIWDYDNDYVHTSLPIRGGGGTGAFIFNGNLQPATEGGNACVIIKEYGYATPVI